MSSQAKLADKIVREQGYGGLLDWALTQRRAVAPPPPWDEVSAQLSKLSNGDVEVRGRVLRKWLLAFEAEQSEGVAK